MAQLTAKEIAAVVGMVAAIAEVIRELGSIPSGHLYASLADKMDIHTYNVVIARLKGAGLVAEAAHVLRWIGPHIQK